MSHTLTHPAVHIQTLSTSPRLHIVDEFLQGDEIAHVLGLAEDPARLNPKIETKHDHSGFSFEMPVGRDPVLNAIRARIAALLGFGNDVDATFRFRRYAPGESHPQHTDAFADYGSELIVTAMIGLVAPEAGGETHFPFAAEGPIAVPPQRGRLVLWYNHTPDGTVDQLSTHSASRVDAGEKTTLTAFVYKPTYYAAAPFPAQPRELPCRRVALLHGGARTPVLQAWRNAAEWVGFAVETLDAREMQAVPAADVLLPIDLSPAVQRTLSTHYREGWTNVFAAAPRSCLDVPQWLAREGLPVRQDLHCLSANPDVLTDLVHQLGGFPVEASIGTWIVVHDMESLSRLVQRSLELRQCPTLRRPASVAERRWVAVVNDQVIGPPSPAGVEALAIRAVRALQARTGIVDYALDDAGAPVLVGVNAPAELSQFPAGWWSAFCLAVLQWLDGTVAHPVIDPAAVPDDWPRASRVATN